MIDTLYKTYQNIFGEKESLRSFFAPGRVNLIGEHIDYNGGHVFPCALDIGTYALVGKRKDNKFCFYSTNFSQIGTIEIYALTKPVYDKVHDWVNYPKGMLDIFAKNGFVPTHGLNIVIGGNIPNGAGLSSSASLEMLMAVILNNIFEFEISPIDMVKWGQMAENNFIGVASGIMDQFASMMGKKGNAILLNCNSLQYSYAPLDLNDYTIVIINSNKRRGLADSKYNERVRECASALKQLQQKLPITNLCELDKDTLSKNISLITEPVNQSRALHVVTENERTLNALKTLNNHDLNAFGRLMIESHISLRDNYAVTGIELDTLVEESLKIKGTIGSRMTGAGFGGCTVNIVKLENLDEFTETVSLNYTKKIGLKADFYVATLGEGAREIYGN